MATVKEVSSFADIKVQLVTSFPDLCVYVTKQKYEADGKDEIWFFDDAWADRTIEFVTSSPDIKVQYVDHAYEAGWKDTSHRLQRRIG